MIQALSASDREQGSGLLSTAAIWIDRIILNASRAVLLATMVGLFLGLVIQVLARYVTHYPLAWTAELPTLLFPWLTMSGIVVAAQYGQHFIVAFGVQLMSARAARILFAASQILTAVVFFWLAWTGLTILDVTSHERLPITGIANFWAYLSIVVGFALLAVTALTTLQRSLAYDGDPYTMRKAPPEIQEASE